MEQRELEAYNKKQMALNRDSAVLKSIRTSLCNLYSKYKLFLDHGYAYSGEAGNDPLVTDGLSQSPKESMKSGGTRDLKSLQRFSKKYRNFSQVPKSI